MTQNELDKLIEDLQREYYSIPNDEVVALVNWVRINYHGNVLPMLLVHKLCQVYTEAYDSGYGQCSWDNADSDLQYSLYHTED